MAPSALDTVAQALASGGHVYGANVYPYNSQPAGLRIPKSFGLSTAKEAELRDLAWDWILVGRTDTADFVEYIHECEDFSLDEPSIAQIFDLMVRARRDQQSSWTVDEVTPQLSRAFDELAQIGVVARESFWCCGTCASAAIGDERDDSQTWRGFVYFHDQDAEGMIEERSTYIGYGVFLEAYLSDEVWDALSDAEGQELYERLTVNLMTDEVIPLLERHGIAVSWNQELGTRILLENVDIYVAV